MLEIPDNHKLCSDCNEYKPLDQYYLSHAGNPVKKCKTCYKKYHRDKVEHKFKENGGTNHYYMDCDRYTTQEQKDQVFMVMEVLGWTYTDGVWLKKGVKEIINGNVGFSFHDEVDKQNQVKRYGFISKYFAYERIIQTN
jgi:hypothetical protein